MRNFEKELRKTGFRNDNVMKIIKVACRKIGIDVKTFKKYLKWKEPNLIKFLLKLRKKLGNTNLMKSSKKVFLIKVHYNIRYMKDISLDDDSDYDSEPGNVNHRPEPLDMSSDDDSDYDSESGNVNHRPVPPVNHRPVPLVNHRPVPLVNHRPVPPVNHRPVPLVNHRLVPPVNHRPAPWINRRPVPWINHRPVPLISDNHVSSTSNDN